MKVHVEFDPRECAYKVWAWQPAPGGHYRLEFRPTPRGAIELCQTSDFVPNATSWTDSDTPTLVLPDEIADALIEAVNGISPAEATRDALADARVVRDRLLSLIERSHA